MKDNRINRLETTLFEQAFRHASVGLAVLSKDAGFVYVNEALCDLLGYTKEQLTGMDQFACTHPDDIEEDRRFFRIGQREAHREHVRNKRYRRSDGAYIRVALRLSSMDGGGSGPSHFIATIEPFGEGGQEGMKTSLENRLMSGRAGEPAATSRRRAKHLSAELRLAESEERYRTLVDNTLDGIAILKDGKWQYVNQAGMELLGAASRGDIIGRDIREFVDDENGESARRQVEALRRNLQVSDAFEVKLRALNGRALITEIVGLPVIYEEEPMVQVIIRDVTLQREAYDRMLRSEKLSIVGQLAAGIAHEIRNPLTSIRGFIQLLKSGMPNKLEYYTIMLEELDRIELIVSELLMLAKPQTSKHQAVPIGDIVYEVMALIEAQMHMQNIGFTCELHDERAAIYCDKNQIKQVLLNILKNAIEAMPNGGEIKLTSRADEEGITLSVIDEGEGIPEEILHRIGEPFFTTKERGTGLGLMISYKIMENHRGKIRVHSRMQEGTTFELWLPASGEEGADG